MVTRHFIAAGKAHPRTGKGFFGTLREVLKKINQGQPDVAINKLYAFIDQVEAAMNADQLQPVDGLPLIDAAQRIIESLGG
jgi:hypothetical protein